MLLSDYIELLQNIQKKHGNIPVYRYGVNKVKEAPKPEMKHLRILSKRESRQDYWEEWRSHCTEENKGEKVVAL